MDDHHEGLRFEVVSRAVTQMLGHSHAVQWRDVAFLVLDRETGVSEHFEEVRSHEPVDVLDFVAEQDRLRRIPRRGWADLS